MTHTTKPMTHYMMISWLHLVLRILLLMLHLQQELSLILQDTSLDLDMILHQFPSLFAQTDRPLQTTIVMIILKLPINITIHLFITFILHQIQLPIQISTNITLKLLQLPQHKTPSYNYHIPLLHRIYLLKIKELRILQLLILISHKFLKEDFKTLHLHIYLLILCIRCIQILTLIQIHYHNPTYTSSTHTTISSSTPIFTNATRYLY